MQTLHFKAQSFLSKPSCFFINPIPKSHISLQSSVFAPRSHLFSLSHQSQTQIPVVNARKKRTANGSLKLQRFLLRLVPIIASMTHLLRLKPNLASNQEARNQICLWAPEKHEAVAKDKSKLA